MTLEELHAQVRAFVDARDWSRYHSPRNLAMALSVEAAELLEVYLWTPDDAPPTPDRTAKAADEAADVMICLLNFCDRAGIDLGAAVVAKLGRAAEKYPADQVRGKALKYDAYPTWDGTGHRVRHHLDVAASPSELPSDARLVLVERGVPAELRLPGWVGPTLFTSALGSGTMRAAAGGYVVGEIRETQGSGQVLSEFVLRVAQGDVVLVDLPEERVRPVNRSLGAFVDAIEMFHARFTALPPKPSAAELIAVIDDVRVVDPGAFGDLDGYWSMWLEELAG